MSRRRYKPNRSYPSDYRFSRCTDTRNAPQNLHWAKYDDIDVEHELVEAVQAVVPAIDIIDTVTEIKAILTRVSSCNALDPEDVKNLSRDKALFEIRFQLDSVGLLLRLYVTEPDLAPHHIVILRAHAKKVGVSIDSRRLQNREIDEASRRRVKGMPKRWGLP